MKNKERFLILLAILMMAGIRANGQCTPDPDCKDDDDTPGQFCPLDLPDGVINMEYDETITVIPPAAYEISGFNVTILYIQIDSVLNLPPGIDYFPSADTLYPDTAYCIQLTGTPTQLGVDTLELYISATADVFGTPTKAQVVDDTTLRIRINETVSIAPKEGSEFQVYQNVPNPFSELTRLDYYMPFSGEIELNVYNLQGVQVHHEAELVSPGEHSFGFDGKGLPPGTYIYRVKNHHSSISGKLIKSR
jgi:hypothetical protein